MGANLPPLPISAVCLLVLVYMTVFMKSDKGDRKFRWKVLVFWIFMISSSLTLFVVMVVNGGGTDILKSGIHCKIGGALAMVNADWVHWPCHKGCVNQILKGATGIGAGFCNNGGECSCSDIPINLSEFESSLRRSCDIGEESCTKSCQAIGQKNGKCQKNHKFQKICECSQETFTKMQLELCSNESTCHRHCQQNGGEDGSCHGWHCQCTSPTVTRKNQQNTQAIPLARNMISAEKFKATQAIFEKYPL